MIKKFTVNRMSHDMLNNKFEIEFTLIKGNENKTIIQRFNDRTSAELYLYANMRDFILGLLDDYVNHKKHIIEAGNHPNQIKPLAICTDALTRFHAGYKSLETIADQFIKGYNWFETILPAQQNPSYQSSIEALEIIKNFCLNVIAKKLPQ
jgi:hypothetical protein